MYEVNQINYIIFLFLAPRAMCSSSNLETKWVPARQPFSTCWTSPPSHTDWASSRCMTMAVCTALRCLTSQKLHSKPGSWRWASLAVPRPWPGANSKNNHLKLSPNYNFIKCLHKLQDKLQSSLCSAVLSFPLHTITWCLLSLSVCIPWLAGTLVSDKYTSCLIHRQWISLPMCVILRTRLTWGGR